MFLVVVVAKVVTWLKKRLVNKKEKKNLRSNDRELVCMFFKLMVTMTEVVTWLKKALVNKNEKRKKLTFKRR
jgi:hypothetical protein